MEQLFIKLARVIFRLYKLRSLVAFVVVGDFSIGNRIAVFFAPGVDISQKIIEFHLAGDFETGIGRWED